MRRSRRNPTRLSDPSRVPSGQKTLNPKLERASETDKANWNGFCEIESEPVSAWFTLVKPLWLPHWQQAFFNVMLQDFGVKGVKIQEVISLDEELLAFIP